MIDVSEALSRPGITKSDYTYQDPNFTVRDFSDNLQLIVREKKFTERAIYLQKRSEACGGSKKAADTIEEAVLRNDKITAEMPEMHDLDLLTK